MKGRLLAAAAAASFAVVFSLVAMGQGADVATLTAQKRVFNSRCVACHTVAKDGGQMVGPNLFGVVGTKAGSKAGFVYSDALRNSGIAWTDVTLDAFLKDPQKVVPGCHMAFPGLSSEADRAAVIAYLQSVSSQ